MFSFVISSVPLFVEARKHLRYKTIITSRGETQVSPLRCIHSKQCSNDIQMIFNIQICLLPQLKFRHILHNHHRKPSSQQQDSCHPPFVVYGIPRCRSTALRIGGQLSVSKVQIKAALVRRAAATEIRQQKGSVL